MTTETLTLSQFLEARIAEDEAVALAAIDETRIDSHATSTLVDGHYVTTRHEREVVDDGIWHTGNHRSDDAQVYGVNMQIYDEGGHSAEQATHIARHDPARVLATCKAHRAIVQFHGSEILGICQEYDGDPYPCRTLRALASIYDDHPSFDPRWAL